MAVEIDSNVTENLSDKTVLGLIRRETVDIYNRIHSIADDIEFVNLVHAAYPDLPVLPNLRCGAWYVDPAISAGVPAYFKSTDGHTGNWMFSLRRANMHLVPLISSHGGAILIDSTRAGKHIPDALSKTIPIWCAVVNRAVALRYPDEKCAKWDKALYTPPGVVSAQEHSMIEAQVDNWAKALASSTYAIPLLTRSLRPIWVTPSTSVFPVLSEAYCAVVCVSASRRVDLGWERRSEGFAYVQGAGDDHELWGMGLTPDLFWAHRIQILSATRADINDLVKGIVDAAGPAFTRSQPTPVLPVSGRIQLAAIADVLDVVGRLPEHGSEGIAYILVSVTPLSIPDGPHALILHVDKKLAARQFREHVLPQSMVFTRVALLRGDHVCIACESGSDLSVGIALAALQMFFDDEGHVVVGKHDRSASNMASKTSIGRRLEWILATRPQTRFPSTTRKRVNEFLLTRSSFRP
ncbi:initiator tRNA phosphoribosyl transferase [Fistulina hepatica ATCC 64428]|uniref:Initiator tRNA phosphoribosyl transferase n=1 Tax=Fistulina hepatica ATCC 64428 TaxID=1128425 RepID=A0A0D7AJ59_9AGAR|nr:initiator tRNA phosphoribosyl transferase [Fistulina hepatica ATCC 64428]